MQTHVKVSVIIPVYNAEQFLKEGLDSLLRQTLKEIEIICVDDGSKDNSLKILKEYEKKDSRIRIIAQENQGAGAARNTGMKYAQGVYLSFLDADDFFEADMLEEAYSYSIEKEADICVFNADLYHHSTREFRPCTWAFRREFIPKEQPFSINSAEVADNIFRMFNGWPWDKLFRRKFVEEIGLEFQNLRTTNDMFFVFIGLAKANKIVALDKCLIHQRVAVVTSLSRTREKSWDCFYQGLIAMKEELYKTGVFPRVEKAFVNWAVNFSLWQLNSMSGEAYIKTYKLLRNKAFEEFGLTAHKESYFYSKNEYHQYRKIMEIPVELHLLGEVERYKEECAVQKSNLEKIKMDYERKLDEAYHSKSYRIGHSILFLPGKLKYFIKKRGM